MVAGGGAVALGEGGWLVVVGVAALVSSIVSAIAGLGGGVALLAVLAQFQAPTVAIPVQGAIQLVANSSRAWFLRRSVDRVVVRWASLLLLPASAVGVFLATSLPAAALRNALGVFVLWTTWRTAARAWVRRRRSVGGNGSAGGAGSVDGSDSVGEVGSVEGAGSSGRSVEGVAVPPLSDNAAEGSAERGPVPLTMVHSAREPRRLLAVGAVSGLLNTTVGASGPVTAPFLKAATAAHVAFVATAAMSQVFAHVSKLIVFSGSGWRIGDHLDLIVVGAFGVVAGSWLGTRAVGRIEKSSLDRVFRVVLTLLAIRLIVG